MATTMMDRFVQWNLDFDGDLYGRDERERLRWYEGIATASQLQTIAVPWAAAILVWRLGRPAVLPLAVVLAALLLPLLFSAVYVQRRRVDTTPLVWTPKRLMLSTLTGLPVVVFGIGAYQQFSPNPDAWVAPSIGAVAGLAFGAVMQARQTRKRRRLEAVAVGDED